MPICHKPSRFTGQWSFCNNELGLAHCASTEIKSMTHYCRTYTWLDTGTSNIFPARVLQHKMPRSMRHWEGVKALKLIHISASIK